MASVTYRKHFIPLESSPNVFTKLIHELSGSRDLHVEDVLTLEASMLPPATLAMILVLPTSEAFELRKKEEDAALEEYQGWPGTGGLTWLKQTINNACGFYAAAHVLCNGKAADMIRRDSVLAGVLRMCENKDPAQSARIVEESEKIEDAYKAASKLCETAAPISAEDEVDHHYICFVELNDGRVFELDGDRKAPLEVPTSREGFPGDVLKRIQTYTAEAEDAGFHLMALVQDIEAVAPDDNSLI